MPAPFVKPVMSLVRTILVPYHHHASPAQRVPASVTTRFCTGFSLCVPEGAWHVACELVHQLLVCDLTITEADT